MDKKTALTVTAPALLLAGALALGTTEDPPPVDATTVEEILPDSGLSMNRLNPIEGAPEYEYQNTPHAMMNAADYGMWYSVDMLTDLYVLSETVKTRKALERIADALEAE